MEVVAVSLPWLKGLFLAPIRACRLTVTAAHFSASRGGGWWVQSRVLMVVMVGAPAAVLFFCEAAVRSVDSAAGD